MTVDVVIPVFGHAHLLGQAVDSLGRQEVDVRVVVVDDGNDVPVVLPSLDSCINRVEATLVRCESRGGIARARNIGLARCSGDAVLFLDADDELHSSALKLLGDKLDATGCDAVYGFVEEFGKPIPHARGAKASEQPFALAGSTLLRLSSVRSVGGFDESLGVGEFIDLMARGQRRGWQMEAIGEPVLRRRIHESNTSWSGDPSDFLRVVRRHLEGDEPPSAIQDK